MTEENKTATEAMIENQAPLNPAYEKMVHEEEIKMRLVLPHDKKSRVVVDADLDKVVDAIRVLHEICFMDVGLFHGAYAMHHSQIENEDPMNFFVTMDRAIIINPVITRHSNYTVDSKEGCVSFADKPQITVPRWHKIEVEYVTIMTDPENKDKFKLSTIRKSNLSGHMAFIFQHEIDHGNAQFIYQ